MSDRHKEQVEKLRIKQRQHNAKIFINSAVSECVASMGVVETKQILESYLEYLDEFA